MASKNEVAVTEAPTGLAPLVVAANSMFEAVSLSDVVLPRIYVQAPLSEGVKNGTTRPGDVILAYGADDPAPTFLVDKDNESFVAYVIGREKFAATTSGGGIEFHPDKKRDPSDPDSWEGWFFDLAIPAHEASLPARWMLWKTAGAQAAKAINTLLERKAHVGDMTPLAIKVSVRERTSTRGNHKFHAPVIAPAETNTDDLPIVESIRATAIELRASRGVENEAPVVEQPSFS